MLIVGVRSIPTAPFDGEELCTYPLLPAGEQARGVLVAVGTGVLVGIAVAGEPEGGRLLVGAAVAVLFNCPGGILAVAVAVGKPNPMEGVGVLEGIEVAVCVALGIWPGGMVGLLPGFVEVAVGEGAIVLVAVTVGPPGVTLGAAVCVARGVDEGGWITVAVKVGPPGVTLGPWVGGALVVGVFVLAPGWVAPGPPVVGVAVGVTVGLGVTLGTGVLSADWIVASFSGTFPLRLSFSADSMMEISTAASWEEKLSAL